MSTIAHIEHIESDALDLHLVALGHSHGDDVDATLLPHDRDAMRPVSEGSEPSDVIGMEMGVYSLDELQVQLAQKLEVAIHLLQHGIDDEGFATTSTG